MDIHPTVDEIYTAVHEAHPTISKTTVYRNLRHLAENGTIRQISISDGLERYDARTYLHNHFKCKICGVIHDVEMAYMESLDENIKGKYGFQIDEHHVVFTGVCPSCQEKK
jgi:Fe2+ or Zn2+ uptake regulation protein